MKSIKTTLFGIAFILIGIWGTIISLNGGGQFFSFIAFSCPAFGIVTVIASIFEIKKT